MQPATCKAHQLSPPMCSHLLCLLPEGHHRGWQLLLVSLHPSAVLLRKLKLLHRLRCCCQRLQHMLCSLLACASVGTASNGAAVSRQQQCAPGG